MSLLFRWYFIHSTRIALNGISSEKVDFQIQCGPAMGSFNQWIKGTRLEDWHNRHVDEIGFLLMRKASLYLERRFTALQTGCSSLLEKSTRGADRIGDS
jgi:trans-AT polyketide synthase/acyltransferase/oxidoreductase domain-containing protein